MENPEISIGGLGFHVSFSKRAVHNSDGSGAAARHSGYLCVREMVTVFFILIFSPFLFFPFSGGGGGGI